MSSIVTLSQINHDCDSTPMVVCDCICVIVLLTD